MNWQLTFLYPTPQTDMDSEACGTYIFVCGKVCLWGRRCVRDRSGGALLISHIHSTVQSPMNHSGEIYWPSEIVKGFHSTLYGKPFEIYFNVSTFFNVRAGTAIKLVCARLLVSSASRYFSYTKTVCYKAAWFCKQVFVYIFPFIINQKHTNYFFVVQIVLQFAAYSYHSSYLHITANESEASGIHRNNLLPCSKVRWKYILCTYFQNKHYRIYNIFLHNHEYCIYIKYIFRLHFFDKTYYILSIFIYFEMYSCDGKAEFVFKSPNI